MRPTLAALATLALTAGTAMANPYADNLSVRLLPGWRNADGTHTAGLELKLAEGWKTYWRSPGEAGVPPVFTWTGSDNLRDARIVWPRPVVFDQAGMRSIGYEDHVVLPLILTPERADAPITLRGEAAVGICEDVCVPVEMRLTGVLDPSEGRRDPAIAAALASRPYSAREGQVAGVDCSVAPGRYGLTLTVSIAMPDIGGDETVVVETGDPHLWAGDATSTRRGGRLTGETELVHSSGGAFALNRSGLTFTVLGHDRAVEIKGCD
ncbi:protein-disulfide reductase DsbD domain-containing protein [Pseudooceanicola sp. LIPI14-2-Ac024]|uniref:protein-disulfide reductase DsbD domain-containing protein n=1 Tax=Pseudooceanicola sp. LIPI14-2-Ac024 TaxID=3344875 RepID=UPI0035CF9689